jgi:hypothetical protein
MSGCGRAVLNNLSMNLASKEAIHAQVALPKPVNQVVKIVSIDLGQVDGDIIDLSTYQGRDYYLLDWKGRNCLRKVARGNH